MQQLPSLKDVKAKPSRIREVPITHVNYESYLRDLAQESTAVPVLVKEYARHVEQQKDITGQALVVFTRFGIMLKIPYPESVELRKEYVFNQLRNLTLSDNISTNFIDYNSVELNRVLNKWVKEKPELKDTIFQEYTDMFLSSLKVHGSLNYGIPTLEQSIEKHQRNAYALRRTLPVVLRTHANLVTLAEKIPGGVQVNPHHLGEYDTLRCLSTPDLPWLHDVLLTSWSKWFPTKCGSYGPYCATVSNECVTVLGY